MDDKKLLSVVIPNYNKEKYIRKCVESVLEQTYHPIEIIIVDDCSTDSSRDIITDLARNYTCIIPVFQKHNGGVSFARNTGAKNASGQYITFLDSDDFYYNKEKLSKEMQILLGENDRTLSYSKLVYVDEEGNYINKPEVISNEILEGYCVDKIIRNCPFEVLPRDYCIEKTTFFKAGMYDVTSSFYEDLDLLIRLAACSNIKYTGVEGTAYRQVGNGLSSKSKAEQFRGRWKVSFDSFLKIKKCRNFRNLYYLIIWKIKIELKILLKRLFRITGEF